MAKKRTRLRKLLIVGTIAIVLLTLVVQGLVLYLNRSAAGQRFVLDQVISRAEARLDGTLAVGEVESARLFSGARLKSVSVHDTLGNLVLSVDSIGARYSLMELIRGRVEISDVTLWRPRVHLTKLDEEAGWNLASMIRDSAPEAMPDSADTNRMVTAEPDEPGGIRLRGLKIFDGSVELRMPLDGAPDSRSRTEPHPSGTGLLRSIRIEALDADLDRFVWDGDAETRLSAEISDLRMSAYWYEDPARLTELRGEARMEDGRIVIDADRLRFPSSSASGEIEILAGESVSVRSTLDWERLELPDLAWADPRVPESGALSGPVALAFGDDRATADFSSVRVELGDSRMWADGEVALDPSLTFAGLSIRTDPLVLADLNPWLDGAADRTERLGVRGTLDGTLDSLKVSGRFALLDDDAATADSIDYDGAVRFSDGFEMAGLELSAVSIDVATFRALVPDWPLEGAGAFRIRADGRLEEGIRIDASTRFAPGGVTPSSVSAEGVVRRPAEGEVELDVRTQLTPLSLDAVSEQVEGLPLRGDLEGSIALSGPLSRARVLGVLQTENGQLDLSGDMNLTDFSEPYRLDGTLERFRISRYVESLPDSTTLTGTFGFAGRGMSSEEIDGAGELRLTRGLLGDLRVDSGALVFRLSGGTAHLDSLALDGSDVRLRGFGALAMNDVAPPGEVRVDFATEDLGGLRDVVFGPGVIAGDDLTVIERELMFLEGIDPDTLPRAADLALGGRVVGEATLTGSLRSFDVDGSVALDDVVYGRSSVSHADVDFGLLGAPALEGEMSFDVVSDSVSIEGRGYSAGTATITYARPRGRGVVTLRRDADEDYRLRGELERTEERTVLHIDEALFRFDEGRWSLGGPSSIEWRDGGVLVRDFRMVQPGRVGVSVAMNGQVLRGGVADFDIDVEGLPLDNLARLLQVEDRGLAGLLALDLDVTGQVENPRISGRIAVREPTYGSYALTDIQGSLDYQDRAAEVEVTGRFGERDILYAEGTVPIDLGLRDVESRVVDAPVDLTVETDAFPIAILLAVVEDARDVTGTISGTVDVAGPLDQLSPSGELTLSGGAVTLSAVGVRHQGGEGTFNLNPDGTVDVDLLVQAGGDAHVTGIVNLRRDEESERLFDPGFGLSVDFDDFVAMNRRDLRGEISGALQVSGRYRAPLVQGDIQVNEGEVFLEEFERNARIVDVLDPRFEQSFLDLGYNPFLENLRADVNLQLDRNVWLRSPSINVEIGGELLVVYDRRERDIAFIGELTALRGQYVQVRQFRVQQGGTVNFTGQPGMNPELNISATTQVRRVEGDQLDITANLTGTLTDPIIELTTDEPGVSNADLPDYLIWGRPTFDVSGQTNFARSAAGGVITTAAGVGLSQLGSVFAQEVGLDYLAIQQDQSLFASSGLGSGFNSTRVEVGWYLAPDLFVTLLARPLSQSNNSQFAGVRLEWSARDLFSVEGFWEDRFLRQGISGFGGLGIQASKVGGVFFFREWGY